MSTSADRDLFTALCDDAAVFPPGNMPLAQAVPAHSAHERAAYAGVVGAFVLAARDLGTLGTLTGDLPAGSFPLSLTVPVPGLADALAAVTAIPAVRLAGLEVTVPDGMAPQEVVPAIQAARNTADGAAEVPVFVELLRDARRESLIDALASTPFRAKLRTGGVRADLYPDERELAEAVVALVRAGVPFKATAGLHHALRNTDPETGFEQHGFLNLLTAAGAARGGADLEELVGLLAERGPETVAAAVRRLGPEGRESFRSFGTCSIGEPVDELVDLGLLPTDHHTEASS
ncbi:hypothetical protein [Streptomyces malaysiensis]|uniref:hypothetical protein n=1 Tax=Streptomyces malaysiensis TaxID=92644 RepID=UPI002B29CC73|nr:hypothetical protein R8789_08260 [Streptomyces malaysiensis]